jgi:hypothetical protein
MIFRSLRNADRIAQESQKCVPTPVADVSMRRKRRSERCRDMSMSATTVKSILTWNDRCPRQATRNHAHFASDRLIESLRRRSFCSNRIRTTYGRSGITTAPLVTLMLPAKDSTDRILRTHTGNSPHENWRHGDGESPDASTATRNTLDSSRISAVN